jgi:hypothetical protein
MKRFKSKRPLPTLSIREIREELEGEIDMYIYSYREMDGHIRNESCLRTIACHKQLLKILPKK